MKPVMVPQWIIEKKRDGGTLAPEEIAFMIRGYTRGGIPDYQMSAFAMAIFFRGMTAAETAALTDAMLQSGRTMDLGDIAAPKIDKHSTGGIGDKVSLILAPLAACGGVAVPMISGRGLGITGGTLDKLESIPGYRTNLSSREFRRVLAVCGCSIIGQTRTLAPADRKLYALRDVTGTVPSIPLIVSSILSKKLAAGVDGLVFDVKCGAGAFMKTREEATRLARSLGEVAARMGRKTVALITAMDQPLGRAAGNALEVAETLEVLRGGGPADLIRITLALAARMLMLGGAAATEAEAIARIRSKLASGEALERFFAMVRLHGGDCRALKRPNGLPTARYRTAVAAPASGFVTRADADAIGRACLLLGAGRTRTTDRVDPAAGVSGIRKVGERVEAGEPLAVAHSSRRGGMSAAIEVLRSAFAVSDKAPATPRLILGTVET